MKIILFCCLALISLGPDSLGQSHKKEIIKFQRELNKEFNDPKESPLPEEDLKKFSGHPFYPIDEKFRIEAKFTRIENPVSFQMQTTTDRLPVYDIYGQATFQLEGKTYILNIYQSHRLREKKEYKDYLFLPFTDLTNGEETYGGGRYIDLAIPPDNIIVVDFNKAYNPYCAYNYKYSCPIPPKENNIDTAITAGVKNLKL
ncbi:MAG: DUF1684 domain-containing protein [Cyclobacteriaceae bacterium]|nr:DUF1684 domain-containing protein [Cyclobacteriaceae bacterium]